MTNDNPTPPHRFFPDEPGRGPNPRDRRGIEAPPVSAPGSFACTASDPADARRSRQASSGETLGEFVQRTVEIMCFLFLVAALLDLLRGPDDRR